MAIKTPPSVSVITIARNEEATIASVIKETKQTLNKMGGEYEILVNDDASSDKTPDVLKTLLNNEKNIKVFRQEKPLGIAGGMNFLYKKAKYDYIFINPGDGQYSAKDLPKMLKKAMEGYDVVVGKRKNKKYDLKRKIVSYFYNLFPKLLFNVNTYDAGSTKVYRTEVVKKINVNSSGVFDEAERLIRAQLFGYKITSVPVRHLSRLSGEASGAKTTLIVEGIKDMFKLWIELRNK